MSPNWVDNEDGSFSALPGGVPTSAVRGSVPIHDGDYVFYSFDVQRVEGTVRAILYGDTTSQVRSTTSSAQTGYALLSVAGGSFKNALSFQSYPDPTFVGTISNISIRKLELIP